MRVLTTGTLHDSPTQRTSTNGNTFVTAKLRDDTSTPVVWFNLVAFGEIADLLAGQPKGASIAISGKATVTVYAPSEGDARPNISITVDQLATLKGQRRNERKTE
ncbi:single-stranded DNA-binding protein [Geomonas sp. Red32]|uniref:single-stranded DNA-binding protein n=1 Tax=Geomonas sp. Red32 TaxID=2912856 RepID=UPI00202CAC10|nr:single-stranded DNA-binding protein [Geomonas sp. Red32]MCM0083957.1 single-stranded DNA-binding protein [Geomonas sp. Red32]